MEIIKTFIIILLLAVNLFNSDCQSSSDHMPYKNKNLHIEKRVDDLISRMTIEEKVAQTLSSNLEIMVNRNAKFDTLKRDSLLSNGIGQMRDYFHCGIDTSVLIINKLQRYLIENTRLGIPAIIHGEGLHGYVNFDATSFPQACALASTFNMELLDSVYSVIAHEARSRGVTQLLTPVSDVVRDPRWGRYSESFGEDQWLNGEITVQVVESFQGENQDIDRQDHVIATLKHFPGHGTTQGGLNIAPVKCGERELHDVYLYPFEQGVKRAGALSVMASYGEYDGMPTHVNHYLLNDVLRDNWGFDGIVVSDYFAVELLAKGWQWEFYRHFVAHDSTEAAKMALEAGVNVELVESSCYPALVDLVKAGIVSESLIDERIKPILRLKFELGLFENPYVNIAQAKGVTNNKQSDKLAKEAARQSIIMLKNEQKLLPLNTDKYQSVAVIGPNADAVLLGDYSTERPKYYVTVLEGIRERMGQNGFVNYAKGCNLVSPDAQNAKIFAEDEQLITEAVALAKRSDVAILVVGANKETDREGRDRSNNQLMGMQEELIEQITALNIPVVLCIFGGKLYATPSIYEQSDAVFQCWNLGQESGNALAEVIFGDYSPGGKLTVSIPISEGHLPVFYNKRPTAYMRDYAYETNPGGAIYPFGFGLSYAEFEISDIRLSTDTINEGELLDASVIITNKGNTFASEVVQLYLNDVVSSLATPMKQLRGFEKVFLAPDESKEVIFTITPEMLSFRNENLNLITEPGEFIVKIGNSSRDQDLKDASFYLK